MSLIVSNFFFEKLLTSIWCQIQLFLYRSKYFLFIVLCFFHLTFWKISCTTLSFIIYRILFLFLTFFSLTLLNFIIWMYFLFNNFHLIWYFLFDIFYFIFFIWYFLFYIIYFIFFYFYFFYFTFFYCMYIERFQRVE